LTPGIKDFVDASRRRESRRRIAFVAYDLKGTFVLTPSFLIQSNMSTTKQRRPGTVDYSKWDHVEDDSSDEDDGGVRVIRLDEPSSVTIPASNRAESDTGLQPASGPQEIDTLHVAPSEIGISPTNHPSFDVGTAATPTFPPESWISKGGFADLTSDASNTPQDLSFQSPRWLYWNQDRTTVELRIGPIVSIEPSTSRFQWHCQVSGQVAYQDRHCAVAIFDDKHSSESATVPRRPPPRLTISYSLAGDRENKKRKRIAWLVDDLVYPVHCPEDQEDESDSENDGTEERAESMVGKSIDWAIEHVSRASYEKGPDGRAIDTLDDRVRFIRLTLHKATPVPAVTWWWKRPTLSCPEVVLRDASAAQDASESATPQNAWATAWDEAHRQFREKMQRQSNERAGERFE
jgi:hypothetical protein